MGRKEISQMTFFNFISAITIGTIGGALITDKNFSVWEGIYSLIGWSLLTVVLGIIDIKFKSARKLVEGEPLVLNEPPPPIAFRLRKGFLVLRNNQEETKRMLLGARDTLNRVTL